MARNTTTEGPDPVDISVGAKIRDLRIQRGLNQSQLAKPLGLTFQQLQKYENATNRVSCSKLAKIAATLGVQPGYFFDPVEADQEVAPVVVPSRLIRALAHVPGKHVSILSDMAEALADRAGA